MQNAECPTNSELCILNFSFSWNPVLESHQPLRFCKPPPELLGQRDMNQSASSAFSLNSSRTLSERCTRCCCPRSSATISYDISDKWPVLPYQSDCTPLREGRVRSARPV